MYFVKIKNKARARKYDNHFNIFSKKILVQVTEIFLMN